MTPNESHRESERLRELEVLVEARNPVGTGFRIHAAKLSGSINLDGSGQE